jgi:hypothetical protein
LDFMPDRGAGFMWGSLRGEWGHFAVLFTYGLSK